MRLFDIREREVINIRTGRRLGCILDIDFDDEEGCIIAIIIPGPAKYCGLFGREKEYVIEWCDITRFGPDIVLVDIDEEECFVKCGGD